MVAANAQATAVKFDDPGAAGGLMQAVDVLRDDRHATPRQQPLKGGDSPMSGVGAHCGE